MGKGSVRGPEVPPGPKYPKRASTRVKRNSELLTDQPEADVETNEN